MTIPKVETKFVAGDRWYVDPATSSEAVGVSAVVDMYPKAALVPWAAKQAAFFAVNNLDSVSQLVKSGQKPAAIDLIKDAYKRSSGSASDQGTQVHGYTERIALAVMAGTKPKFRCPQGMKPYLKHYVRFLRDFQVKPVMVETTVWHDAGDSSYAGTFDLFGEITIPDDDVLIALGFEPGPQMAIIDTKSGASGVWPPASLQQTAYARAKHYIDPATGKRKVMPKVAAAYGLWLRPEGYALIPLSIDDPEWEQFLRLRASFEWKRTREKYVVGKAINDNPIKRKWQGGSK